MTKLKYDADYLNNHVKPSLDSSNSVLKSAAAAASMSVPSDFRYYSYLSGLDDKLRGYVSQLDSCTNWLEKAISNVDRTLEELQSDVEGLEEPTINEKEKWVLTT